jgi:cbb3-type cytochrome oxidase subunit 1
LHHRGLRSGYGVSHRNRLALCGFWGIAGFTSSSGLLGHHRDLQLAYPALNFDLPWTSFGRLRPLHTSAVIFAFGGNVLLATSILCGPAHLPARMPGAQILPWFVILGYNALHRDRGHGLPARRHAVARNTPSRNGMPTCG